LSALHYEPTEYQKLVLNMFEEADAAALNLKEKKSIMTGSGCFIYA